MKTICSLRQSGYLLLGLAAFAAVSCSSFQNSSYYDQDGVYGGSGEKREVTQAAGENSQDNPYKEYFGTLKRETEIFTNADEYAAVYDTTARESETPPTGYGGWGSESDNVTVNIYGNNWGYWNNWNYWNNWYGPGWGWNSWYGGPYWSIGWGNWYGPGWGWGWASPYYGYGWNNWYGGYYTPHYGHHYGYQPGRRGSSYNAGVRSSNTRQSSGTRSYSQYTTGTRNSGFNPTRTQAPRNTRSEAGSPRSSNNTYSTPRNSGVRTQSAPTRNYSAPSTGGGRSSGGFGSGGSGGRTSGGGRR